EGADSIDVGDEFMGAKYSQIQEIICPKCHIEARHIVNHDPYEIRFESCPNCHGSFFDAGEFRDYMEDQIFEQFQQLIADINS
ncbi:MAG: zf-TFIIB domain-containing protein, partial [Pseudomonadales bacterium]